MFKRKNAIWWVLFLIFIGYLFAEIYKPKPIDWGMNFHSDKKSPYGLYIFSHELPKAFPDSKTITSNENVYNILNNDSLATNELLILVGNIRLSDLEIKKLLKFVAQGNHVLLSQEFYYNSSMLDTFGIATNRHEVYNDTNRNIITLPAYAPLNNDTFYEQSRFANEYFTKDTSVKHFTPFTKLGLLDVDTTLPNVIKLNFGKGDLIASSIPSTFTNIYLLTNHNVNYINGILSTFPDRLNKVILCNYYNITKEDKEEPQTPLRYILLNRPLEICFYIGLGLLLCLISFNSKRRQRLIPIVKPPENESLKFAKNVAMLYYTQKDNGNLISKRLKYFLEHIRKTYYLETNNLDKEFQLKLAEKSNVDKGIIEQIFAFKDAENYQYTDQQLVEFIKLIELFHKEESFYGK